MKRMLIVSLFATLVLSSSHLAEAQKPAKVPRVGYLIPAAGASAQYEAFRQGLRDLGYVIWKDRTLPLSTDLERAAQGWPIWQLSFPN
jgi:hypothetical protein